jgi:hypothetical protein
MRKKLVAGNPILKQYFATKDFFFHTFGAVEESNQAK